MNPLLALWDGPIRTWGFSDILIFCVLVAAGVAIAYAAMQYFGVEPPPVIVKIFWICVVAFVAVFAIIFLAGLFR